MSGPRIGSLCSGVGALDLGLVQVVGGSVAWHCENDRHAAKVLEARFPGVPNLGDIPAVQWTPPCESCGADTVLDRHGVPTYRCDRCCRLWPTSYFPGAVEPVDWVTAGYPCQPESLAGKGLSTDDERWIWPDIARAIGVLRPRHVLLENVAGHVGRGLRVVLGSLASLRYDARWTVVRASSAGAPHERARVFIIASHADSLGHERAGSARGRRRGPANLGQLLADADEPGRQGTEPTARNDLPSRRAATDTSRDGRGEGWPESARLVGRPDAAERGHAPTPDAGSERCDRWPHHEGDGRTPTLRSQAFDHAGDCTASCAVSRDWRGEDGRDYGSAVRRWHDLTRCVPPPTVPDGRDGKHRLNPRFTEWMMGLPAGWVTDILPRNPALKCLGNGVVPAQCALAVRLLLDVEMAAA